MWISSEALSSVSNAISWQNKEGYLRSMTFEVADDVSIFRSTLSKDGTVISDSHLGNMEGEMDGLCLMTIFPEEEDGGLCVLENQNGKTEMILGLCGQNVSFDDPEICSELIEFLETLETNEGLERLKAHLRRKTASKPSNLKALN